MPLPPPPSPSPSHKSVTLADTSAGNGTSTTVTSTSTSTTTTTACPPPGAEYRLSLHVHRLRTDGRTDVDRLELVAVSDVGNLTSVFRKLLEKAFSGRLPDYMTSPAYYLFKPRDEFLEHEGRYGGQYTSTQFRLVAEVDGWETVVCVRGLQDFSEDSTSPLDDGKKMRIAVAQFDSEPVVLEDGTEMQVCVEGYSVSVEKAFLDEVSRMLAQDHTSFYEARFDQDFPVLLKDE